MKYEIFFGETEKKILAAETPKRVMQIAWRAGVILPKQAAIELFRRLYSINLGVLYLNYPDDEPFAEAYRRNRSMVYDLLAAYV